MNHEKELDVDTQCANIAIKYNMIYVSAYQIIKKNIEEKTKWGQKLVAEKKPKNLALSKAIRDRFDEEQYSPVHFDIQLVCNLIKNTIAEMRQNQKFVLLEGMCNSTKLQSADD